MKKGKRKSKSKNVELTSLNKKWASCDIDPNIAFGMYTYNFILQVLPR